MREELLGWRVVTGGRDPEQTRAVFQSGQALSSGKVWSFTPQGKWSANLKGSWLFLLRTKGLRSASKECAGLKQGHLRWVGVGWTDVTALPRLYQLIRASIHIHSEVKFLLLSFVFSKLPHSMDNLFLPDKWASGSTNYFPSSIHDVPRK